MRILLFACGKKIFNLFERFFVGIGLGKVARMAAFGLPKRFDCGCSDWHSMDNVAEKRKKVNKKQARERKRLRDLYHVLISLPFVGRIQAEKHVRALRHDGCWHLAVPFAGGL